MKSIWIDTHQFKSSKLDVRNVSIYIRSNFNTNLYITTTAVLQHTYNFFSLKILDWYAYNKKCDVLFIILFDLCTFFN